VGSVEKIDRILERVDEYQQRRPVPAFLFGVVKKFGDDDAGNLAALVAYYGFFSLFPLLLVLVSVLDIVLSGHPALRRDILDSALGNFPVIGDQIRVQGLPGRGAALAVGVVGALWAGLGAAQTAQDAMNKVWAVQRREWPNFLKKRLRSLEMLGILGVIVIASTFVTGLGTTSDTAFGLRAAAFVASLVLNFALYLLAFRVLTVKVLRWGDVAPGAAFAAVAWTVLQAVGSYVVTQRISGASDVYGTFALVLGLLVWIYLGAQVTLLGAEINVVRRERLWPRSLKPPPLTEGDETVYEDQIKGMQVRPEQTVTVRTRRASRR
jgi:YihY family inner membrane protein